MRAHGISGRIARPLLTVIFAAAPFIAGATIGTPASAATPMVAAATTAAPEMATFDQQMITLINGARAAAHVPALTEARGLDTAAQWWSNQMNSGDTGYQLQHNPNAWTLVAQDGAANRMSWGENVAWSSSTGSTAQDIFTAYMNSPGHKANILSTSYHYIGMGTVGNATHGLWNTTEFTDAVEPGQAIVPAAPTKPAPSVPAPTTATKAAPTSFIKDSSTGAVYRVVGGAPVYVSSFASFTGANTIVNKTHAQVAAMSQYPANGTFIRPANGADVYVIAGGAPVSVSNWAVYGGSKPVTTVDPAAIANAGGSGLWSHLRSKPADGTFIVTPGNGAVYRMAGGAPIYVSSWAPFGGSKPTVVIDPVAVAHAGQSGDWSHLLMYPANGTFIQGAGGTIYQVLNGVPTWLKSWSSVGGPKPFTTVDPKAISAAGTGGVYNHLKN